MNYPHVLASVLAICGTISTTAAAATPNLQGEIQTLQIDILNYINDLVQSKPSQNDFNAGSAVFVTLIKDINGGNAYQCPPGLPGLPADTNAAIGYLQNTQLSLMTVSQDLLQSNAKQALSDACGASNLYAATSGFATS